MKKVGMLIAAIATIALLASCSSTNNSMSNKKGYGMHQDTKGEMMDAKGELRMK